MNAIVSIVKHKGFTLVELIITIAIAAIILGLAVPNYQTFLVNQRVQSLSTTLIAALRLARNEAITRGVNVAICPLDAQQSSCVSSSDWQYGFRVYVPSTNEVIKNYPMDLSQYISACCEQNPQYTATGSITPSACSCPSIPTQQGDNSQANVAYFQLAPNKCSRVYTITVDTIGQPNLIQGASCP